MQIGQSITITAGGFNPSESVGVTLHSTPQTLTPATAASTGSITYNFTVPSGLDDGSHSVVFVGNTSAATQTFAFTLGTTSASPTPTVLGEQVAGGAAPTSMPFTGANIGRPMLFAIAALWSGFVLLLLSRRGGLVIVSSAGGGGSHRRNTMAAAHAAMTAASRGRHRSPGGGHRAR
jgi:hypothetical protein